MGLKRARLVEGLIQQEAYQGPHLHLEELWRVEEEGEGDNGEDVDPGWPLLWELKTVTIVYLFIY